MLPPFQISDSDTLPSLASLVVEIGIDLPLALPHSGKSSAVILPCAIGRRMDLAQDLGRDAVV